MLYVGVLLSILLIVGLAVYSGSGHQKKTAVGPGLVLGIVLGTMVGGSSTIGTAQFAYVRGFSAWWFTLGAALASLVLGLVFSGALRRTGKTLVGIIGAEFGQRAEITVSALNCLGTYIAVIGQIIAATSVIAVIVPSVPYAASVFAGTVLMVLYAVFGGTRGAGMVGMLKLFLVFTATVCCGIMAWCLSGGYQGFPGMVQGISNPESVNFFDLFNRGVGTELGSCGSMIAGILTTQIYAQAMTSASTTKAAKQGAVLSAMLLPLIGLGGILVGLYMRAHFPGIVPRTAMTQFVLTLMPGRALPA